jgi:hypothetical protein
VVHIQSQEAGMEVVADIPVPLGQIVVAVRVGLPGGVLRV